MDATASATLFAWLDREVWLVTSTWDGVRGGLIATFVGPASIVPDMPRVLVGLSKLHHTWELVAKSGRFALHLLSENNLDLVWRFGLHSGRDGDKFEGLAVETGPRGCPLLREATGWLECEVEADLDTGDRTVFLARVLDGQVTHFAPPLTTKRLMELAPAHLLAEMNRQRHLDGHLDADAIRAWREGREGGAGS